MNKKLITVLGFALLLGAGGLAFLLLGDWGEHSPLEHAMAPSDPAVEYWTCSMHPSVRSNQPGTCPICSMDLTPVHREHSHEATGEAEYWTCPMHDSVRADGPGSCPLCGMDLEPVYTQDSTAPAAARTEFVIDPYRRQLINVQTTPVEERVLEQEIRAVGTLALDETRISDVFPRVSGWIREVYVNYMHQHVHQGQPLFSLYSPELVASQEEYVLALQTVEQLGSSPFEHVSSGARSLRNAARRRLELFDVSTEQVQRLEQTGEVQETIVIHSPVSGHVIERNAFANRHVGPDTKVYTIADHTRIWAWVQIYEHEIGQVRIGQPAIMRTAAYPGQVFQGRVTFMNPHLDPQTRTQSFRLEFPNPNLRLKPEMYVEVELKVAQGRHPVVPDSAVLRTGQRDLVFVEKGEGRMELRAVTVGHKAGGYYQVLSGLEIGERVVSHANFLVDAESKIRGVGAGWETPRPVHVH